MPQLDSNRGVVSVTEARQKYDLSTTYLGHLLRKNIIEGVKTGKMWLIYEDSLQLFLSKPRKSGPKPRLKSVD